MPAKNLPFEIAVASPCSEDWAAMDGDGRSRHCAVCDRQVHDLARMTPDEIEDLVVRTGGRLCGRVTRRSDGALVTLQPEIKQAGWVPLAASVMLAAGAGSAFTQSSAIGMQSSATGMLRGSVMDATHAVIPGASVTMTGNGISKQTKTDAQGRFVVEVPAGEYRLKIASSGFKLREDIFSVQPGQKVELEEKLDIADVSGPMIVMPGSDVMGSVQDVTGRAIPHAKVQILQNKNVMQSTETDNEGEFHIMLTQGEYELLVESPGFLALRQKVKLDQQIEVLPVVHLQVGSAEMGEIIVIETTPLKKTKTAFHYPIWRIKSWLVEKS